MSKTFDVSATLPASGEAARPTDAAGGRLPAAARLGTVELVVSDLERSIRFYEEQLGLHANARDRDRVDLTAAPDGGSEPLLALVERPDARPSGSFANLFHVALKTPSRDELALTYRRILDAGGSLAYAIDHWPHSSIYIDDPDGSTVELLVDKPAEAWGVLQEEIDLYYRSPPPPALDLDALAAAAQPAGGAYAPARGATRWSVNHVHFDTAVADYERARDFYVPALGFELNAEHLAWRVLFGRVGSYHHHVAVNAWRKLDRRPDAGLELAGIRRWSLILPDQADVDATASRLRQHGFAVASLDDGAIESSDPAGITVRVGRDA